MTQTETLRVGVVFGGRSGEHAVSLNSAQNVMEALRQAGHLRDTDWRDNPGSVADPR
jgi:D-alanine-D-alanine ligase-like ATP-grasp enzyme